MVSIQRGVTKKIILKLGMVSVLLYFIHVFLGQYLWKEYNWITTDISSLTARGAPNAELLSMFSIFSGICAIIFFIGMIMKSREEKYSKITQLGYVFFLILMIISNIGYSLFPLEGNKAEMTFSNLMHIFVTVAIVILVLTSMFLLSYGYLKKDKMKKIGYITLGFAILIALSGLLNPIVLSNNWNILGVTERINIFSLEIYIFILSYMYGFNKELR